MTFWKDQFRREGARFVYSNVARVDLPDWKDQHGNRERIENLKWARDNCDGLLMVVVVVAVDLNATSRKIANSYAQRNLIMRLIDLNETTGEFSAVSMDV